MVSTQLDRLNPSNESAVRVFSGPGFACQILVTDYILEVNNGTTASTTVTLPDLGGGPYTVVDGANAATAFPILVETSSGLVEGRISSNGGALTFAWDGVQWVVINVPPLGSLQQGLTGQFYVTQGAVIDRFADRVLVGYAISNKGDTTTTAPTDWLDVYQAIVGLDATNLSQFAVLADGIGEVASLGGNRSLNHTQAGQSAIGVAGYAYNDNLTLLSNGWSYYGESYKMNTTVGRAYSAELAVVNQSGTTYPVNPYSVPTGATIGIQYDSGNGFGTAQQTGLKSASAPILLFQNTNDNSSPWLTGIVAFLNSIKPNANSVSEVVSMPVGYGIQWYTAAPALSSSISCTVTSTTNAASILFQSGGMGIVGVTGAPIALFQSVSASTVNFVQFQGAITAGTPQIAGTGSDSNVGLVLTGKGSGLVEVGSNFAPTVDNTYSCGVSGARFTAFWGANNAIQTSDARLKTDIATLPPALPILRDLNPVTYRWIDGGKRPVISMAMVDEDVFEDVPDTIDEHEVQPDGSVHLVTKQITRRVQIFDEVPVTLPDGTPVIDQIPIMVRGKPESYRPTPRMHKIPRRQKIARDQIEYVNGPGKRTHWGFLAGDVKAALDKTGMDFAGYVKGEDGVEGLRDGQLMAILWKACQEMASEIQTMKEARP